MTARRKPPAPDTRNRLVRVAIDVDPAATAYPFGVPAVRRTPALEFREPVTFFVGENGSGKSTLLEGLAAKVHLPTIGETSVERDETLEHARRLAAWMELTWSRMGRTHRGFFLRAEDFFGFTKALARQRAELQRELREVEQEYADRSAMAKALRLGPVAGSLDAMERRYGADFDAQSHGEGFLSLFRANATSRSRLRSWVRHSSSSGISSMSTSWFSCGASSHLSPRYRW